MSNTKSIEGQSVSARVAELEKELEALKNLRGMEQLLADVHELHAQLCNDPHVNNYPTTDCYCTYFDEGYEVDAWTKPAHQKWLSAVENVKFPIENIKGLKQVIQNLSEASRVF